MLPSIIHLANSAAEKVMPGKEACGLSTRSTGKMKQKIQVKSQSTTTKQLLHDSISTF